MTSGDLESCLIAEVLYEDKLHARIERLEKALLPFAKAAWEGDFKTGVVPDDTISPRHVQEARAALGEKFKPELKG